MRTCTAPRLRYRVLDGKTGAVVIDDLPHLHTSHWDVIGFAPGILGAATAGAFDIPLYPPSSPKGKQYAALYALLAFNMRVEGYLGDVFGGDPKVTGVIRGLPRSRDAYAITGFDSTRLAEDAALNRAEAFTGTTDLLIGAGLKGWSESYSDDFSGASPMSAYTIVTGATPAWAIAANEGWSTAMSKSAVGNVAVNNHALILSNTSLAASAYTGAFTIHTYLRMVPASFAFANETFLVFGATSNTNFYVVVLYLTQNSDGTVGVNARISHTSDGLAHEDLTPTSKYFAGPLVRLPTLTARLSVQLTGYQSGGNTVCRVIVNGVDAGFNYTITGIPSGKIGFAMYEAGNTQSVWFDNVVFLTRAANFQPGTITVGSRALTQVFSNESMLNLWNIAATAEGVSWRKNPKAGLGQDTVDFGAAASEDLSNSVRFEEGQNLVDLTVEPNSLEPATMIDLNGSPGSDNAGTITAFNVPALQKYGVVQGSQSVQGLADFLSLRRYAQSLVTLTGTPEQAKTARVMRDADTIEKWREGSTVMLLYPTLQVNYLPAKVVAYTLDERVAYQDVTFDQYPDSVSSLRMAQLLRTLQQARDGSRLITQSVVGGLTFDANTGSPNVMPFSGGLQALGAVGVAAWNAAGNYRLRFKTPETAGIHQRVALAFSTTIVGVPAITVWVDTVDHTVALGGGAGFGSGDIGELDLSLWASASGWHEVQLSSTIAGNGIAHVYSYALAKPI